ncbi:protein-export chaperone SecB [Microbispora sp. H11081]|uniref:protein-export chaperone SecB n=1 Tax=Microbispora sp. H11081 TaxID=2729107 RepID=UPI001474D7CE|nr:protein-export chaperone SecB [Microbispora sp. H11081]
MLVEMQVSDLIAAASRVEDHVKLTGLRLTETSSWSREPPTAAQLQTGMTINVTARSDGTRVIADVEYNVRAEERECGGDQAGERCWEVKCHYSVEYEAYTDVALATQDLEAFGIMSTTLTIHPYARAFIHDITAQMGYPPFNLPLLTTRDLAEMAKNAKITV